LPFAIAIGECGTIECLDRTNKIERHDSIEYEKSNPLGSHLQNNLREPKF
jgi:hypothetical protein